MSGGADDRLLFGAAAPATQRVIGSIERRDALWALVCAAALIVASAFDLVERGAASLRMGEAPLRIAAWIIPALSIVVAVLAVVRRSAAIAAISTGLLAPCVALAGVLSLTLFLDRASAFTDVGVPLTLGAAFVGVAMLVRWFVYHPGGADIEESRPIPVLARSLAELVSPEGGLPVLSRLRLDQLPVTLAPEPPGAGEAVDPDWLEVVATVRSAVARLDAEQLRRRVAGETPLASWSSRPGDPWQADLGPDPAPEGLRPSTHLVAAFGPDGALDAAGDPTRLVALGLVDSWSEVVPGTEHSTHVAFHYDAPGARAPQAVLVVVPPVVDQPLDAAALVDVVLETRELARARMAVPAVLDHWSAAAPTTVLPVHDPGVDLQRSP